MRISGGELGGRKIKVPSGDAVRPTQDRVREALFSMLMGVIPEAVFVDLFAGSGAVGLEAHSRGARRVIWVEKDRRHAALIRENVTLLINQGEVVCLDAIRWAEGPGRGLLADVVFADPPYVLGQDQGFVKLMTALSDKRVLRAGGIFIAEMPVSRQADDVAGWTLLRDRTYGHTRLALYELVSEPA